jgi:hypothetical protein
MPSISTSELPGIPPATAIVVRTGGSGPKRPKWFALQVLAVETSRSYVATLVAKAKVGDVGGDTQALGQLGPGKPQPLANRIRRTSSPVIGLDLQQITELRPLRAATRHRLELKELITLPRKRSLMAGSVPGSAVIVRGQE